MVCYPSPQKKYAQGAIMVSHIGLVGLGKMGTACANACVGAVSR